MPRRIIGVSAASLLSVCAAIAAMMYFRHAPAEGGAADHLPLATGEHAPSDEEAAPAPDSHRGPGAKTAPEGASHPANAENQHAVDASPVEPAEVPDFRSGPAHEVVQTALTSLSPESGLRQLEAALALPHTPEQAALLHEARGELYAQLAPPDFAQSQAAFEKALEMTNYELLEEEIRYKMVRILMQGGDSEEASKVAGAQLKLHPPASDTGFKLQLLLGQLQERAGRADLAEESYRSVLDAMGAIPEFLSAEESVSLARLAVLRLTHLYRAGGRDKDVDAVLALLKKQIARTQTASGS